MAKRSAVNFDERLRRRSEQLGAAGDSVGSQDTSLNEGAVTGGPETPSLASSGGAVAMELPLDMINVRKGFNARQNFEQITELIDSMREYGLLQPIVVMPSTEAGKYDLISGGRRFHAATELGWTQILAVVRQRSEDLEQRILMLTENEQRADVDPLELGLYYKEILDKHPEMKASHLAMRLGVRVPLVYSRIRLLDVKALHPLLSDKTISISVADELQRLFEDGVERKEGVFAAYLKWYLQAKPTVKELQLSVTRTLQSQFTYVPGMRAPEPAPVVRSIYPKIERQAAVLAKRVPQLNTLELAQMKTLYQSLLADVDEELRRRLNVETDVAATAEGGGQGAAFEES